MVFENTGDTFSGYYEACHWCSTHGYSYGSMDAGGRKNPIAIVKGQYDLSQKWHNLSAVEKKYIDGVMESNNWRNGSVKILIFE